MNRIYWHGTIITRLKENEVFVFGSNPEGRHGKGAAKAAQSFGAKYGQGRGLMGQSYGLVTKNLKAGYVEKSTGIKYEKAYERSVSPSMITENIRELYETAKNNPEKRFLITFQYEEDSQGNPKSTLNGYNGQEMVDMFLNHDDIPENIVFHISYKQHFENKLKQQEKSQFSNKSENISRPNQSHKESDFLGLTAHVAKDGTKIIPFFRSNNIMSQWHPSLFTYKGKTFISCEQFMMYSKAMLFSDETAAFKILDINQSNPTIRKFISGELSTDDIIRNKELLQKWNEGQQYIKQEGRKVLNFNESVWDSKKISIVAVANREKFYQNEYLLKLLQSTGDSILVEASPYDKIWGAGIKKEDPRITDPNQWLGQNLLGKTLMQVRETLKLNKKPKAVI